VPSFFGREAPRAPFRMFGRAHWGALASVVLVNVALVAAAPALTPESGLRPWLRWGLAALLVVNELLFHLWNWRAGMWTVQTMLPVHLCSFMVWGGAALLAGLVHSTLLYELLYFIGIGGALQALFQPDIGVYGYPHFRFFQTFIAHGGIIAAALYFTAVEGMRPHWISILHVAIFIQVYLAFGGLVNWWLGSNYMFIARKPDMPTLLDKMGPWPWYVLGMELIGVAWAVLSYLPFAIRDL
jgi:hypothetical integral membrane protein (TIGR02206 family)